MSDDKGQDSEGPADDRQESKGQASSEDDGESTGGTRLPAFGFAADLLRDHENARAAEPIEASAIDPEDPERIYAFADHVDEATTRPTPTTGPEPRIETWVTFGLRSEVYALPVEPIREVLRVTQITRVPHAPSPIRGVTQMRGRVLPVIDLRVRLGLPEGAIDRASRILVVASRNRLIGLLVDHVDHVTHLDLNHAQPPPRDVVGPQSDFVTAVYHEADRLILMLDVDRTMRIHEAAGAA